MQNGASMRNARLLERGSRGTLASLFLFISLLASGCTAGQIVGDDDADTADDKHKPPEPQSPPEPVPEPTPAPPPTGPDSSNPPVTMVTRSFVESSANLVNPERGFYVGLNLVAGTGAASVRSRGHSLAIAIVRLDAYRDKPLDQPLLDALDAGFANVRANGIKVMLRFSYNSSFTDDASKSRILQHIAQLAPVLARHQDVISVMQAGFIGAWGEWHSSTNGLDNTTDRTDILNALLAALPASRAVQVRTPMFKSASFGGALTQEEAWSGTNRARLGHHNDCFLASANDLGTYASPAADWEAYVAQDGRFTPIGGETCKLNAPRTDCPAAVAEMKTNHWSYLNLEYHQDVLGSWTTQGCMDDVQIGLGYRLVLQEVVHPDRASAGGALDLRVTLVNRGFAALYNQRPLVVVLTQGTTRREIPIEAIDPRRWEPGAPFSVDVHAALPADLAPGTYRVSLWLPDADEALRGDPRYAVQLANEGVWDAERGENVIIPELTVD